MTFDVLGIPHARVKRHYGTASVALQHELDFFFCFVDTVGFQHDDASVKKKNAVDLEFTLD